MPTKEEYANEKKEFLRKHIKPRDRLFFVERHHSSNYRWLDVYCFYQDPNVDDGSVRSWRLTSIVAIVCGMVYDYQYEAIKVPRGSYATDQLVADTLGRALFDNPLALKFETLR